MQVTKKQAGKYKVVVHGLQFVLQGGFGEKSWTLWNADGTQVAKAETKSGLIQTLLRRVTWCLISCALRLVVCFQ